MQVGQPLFVIDPAKPDEVFFGELVSEPMRGGEVERRIKGKAYSTEEIPTKIRVLVRSMFEASMEGIAKRAVEDTRPVGGIRREQSLESEAGRFKAVLEQVDEALNAYTLTGQAPDFFIEEVKGKARHDQHLILNMSGPAKSLE
jgi:hypothetical protein